MEKRPDITFEVIKCEEGLYVSKRHMEYRHSINFMNERFNGFRERNPLSL